MEAVPHKYIFVVKTFNTRWRFAYPYASLHSGFLLRRPLPFHTDVNGRDCVIWESLEGPFGGELFGSNFFLPPLPWAVCFLACPITEVSTKGSVFNLRDCLLFHEFLHFMLSRNLS
jgi:hypothetical protein